MKTAWPRHPDLTAAAWISISLWMLVAFMLWGLTRSSGSNEESEQRSGSMWSDRIEIGDTVWEGWVPTDPNEPYIIFPKE